MRDKAVGDLTVGGLLDVSSPMFRRFCHFVARVLPAVEKRRARKQGVVVVVEGEAGVRI